MVNKKKRAAREEPIAARDRVARAKAPAVGVLQRAAMAVLFPTPCDATAPGRPKSIETRMAFDRAGYESAACRSPARR